MINLKCQDDTENLKANHKANHARKGTTSIQQYMKLHKKKTNGKVAFICAPGPGLKDHIMQIKERRQNDPNCIIFAVKCGHVLDKAGIPVDFNVHVDTKETELKYTYHNKHTTQLISTQCHPKLFDLYAKDKVVRFQSRTSAEWHPGTIVAQGSNTTMQAISLACFLGCASSVLYGFDLSWDVDNTTHLTGDREMTLQNPSIEIKLNDGSVVNTNLIMLGACQEAYMALSQSPKPVSVIGKRLLAEYILDKQKGNGKCVLDDQIQQILTANLNDDIHAKLRQNPQFFRSFPVFTIHPNYHVEERMAA